MRISFDENNDKHSTVESLLEMMTNLNERVQREQTLSCITKDEYAELYGQFKILDQNIFDHKDLSIDSNDRLEQLVDIMSSMANLDFSQEAVVRDDYNHLDYIAISLNLMRERLEQRVKELKRVGHVLDALNDLYIITDMDGMVLRLNKVLTTQYQIAQDEVVGMHITDFFNLPEIQENYGIDIQRDRVIHDLQQGYTPSDNSEIVLRVSGKVYLNEHDVEEGYVYKVKAVNKGLYTQHQLKTTEEKETEVIDALNAIIQKMNTTTNRRSEEREILKGIQQSYTDKNELTLMETMILNSINQLLDRY